MAVVYHRFGVSLVAGMCCQIVTSKERLRDLFIDMYTDMLDDDQQVSSLS